MTCDHRTDQVAEPHAHRRKGSLYMGHIACNGIEIKGRTEYRSDTALGDCQL